jgi:Pentapeptide repeats (8 copies)
MIVEFASGLSVLVTSAVTVAIIGAFATIWVGFQNSRRQREALELVRSGQVTDRFTKAIDQLGSGNVSVRIGAIFALERIAADSRVYRSNVSDVLAAFVRNRLPSNNVPVPSAYVPVLLTRAPDVQAALTALSRSPLCDERVESTDEDRVVLDLSRTDLRRARLAHANLQRVNLWGARLEGADFRYANLQGAILEDANFGRFEPPNPNYQQGTDLSFADLTGARLKGAKNWNEAVKTGTKGLG